MRAKRVKQEIGVNSLFSPLRRPFPEDTRMARGEARDPISVRTSLPQTLQQQQDLARIVPVAGARLAVSPPLAPFPPPARSPEPRYPIRDLWIIARLIPSARPPETRIYRGRRRFDSIR